MATECTEGCEEPSEFARNSAPAAEVAQPGATLDEVFVPLAADEYRDAADLGDQTQPLVADAAVAQVDSPVAPVLLADSRPVQAAEPTGELIADARGPATAPTAAAEASPVAAGGPPVESDYPGAAEAASFQQSRSPAEPAATSAGSSIPEHLARIGERYAAVPIAEPGATDRGLVERESAPADQSALVERSVALDLAGSAGSNVIVQDDELVAIRLGELVSLLEDRLDHPLYVWMSSASVASKFVTAQTLAAAGIHSRYDPERKQLVISTTGE